jgi:hypothetical protein
LLPESTDACGVLRAHSPERDTVTDKTGDLVGEEWARVNVVSAFLVYGGIKTHARCVGKFDEDAVATMRRMLDRAASMTGPNTAGNDADKADEAISEFQFRIEKLFGGKIRLVLSTLDDMELELNSATLDPEMVTPYTTTLPP